MNTNCNVYFKNKHLLRSRYRFFDHGKEEEKEGDQSDVITMALKDWQV